ncbi:MAG: hypothetical protein ACIAQU_02875, partial [Phycisphaerales bacterium JB064]
MPKVCARINAYVALIVLCLVFSARAGVEVTRSDARLVIAAETLPDALDSGQWSLMVWVYAPEGVREYSSLLSIGGRLEVHADPSGIYVTGQHLGRGARQELASPLEAGRWHLLAVSMDAGGVGLRSWL